jgi:predicted DCC family thiol-disulfide oxidoreductase YuxK
LTAALLPPQTARPSQPLVVYDGACTFCVYWVRYWQALTGAAVSYRPYQEVAAQFPSIAPAEFRRAVQYISPTGEVAAGAEASFLTLAHAQGRGIWLALYRQLPGFAALAERAYAFTAAHRGACYRVSRLLWGAQHRPPTYGIASYLFLRLFGLIYLAAFVSFAVQAGGLIGSHGILPLHEFRSAVGAALGAQRWWTMPMLFWLDDSDQAIAAVCWGGALAALLLALNVWPRLCLLLTYLCYLSLLYGGQEFMTYQWDVFLLEGGVLALFMTCSPRTGRWLLYWLLLRFMFMSGMVKLLSGDPSWRDLNALAFHFYTQPLPTPLAWYAAQLPQGLLRAATGAMLVIELVLPFLLFAPRRLRWVAAGGILLLQSCIVLTGNYNWFNLQTLLLCLLLFDDAALQGALPRWLLRRVPLASPPPRAAPTGRWLSAACASVLLSVSLVQMAERFGLTPPRGAQSFTALLEPLHLVSPYGLFAVMTTERNEIIIEGSRDGISWSPYEFRYKPGELARRPPWNIPHQPRLDWQMWFAALEDPRGLRWFWRFLQKLLENDPAVTGLLRSNPFAGRPPTFLRARFYRYTFSDPAQKAQGQWWQRTLLGEYTPEVSLRAAPAP